MKKVFLVMFGIFFVLFTGGSLLICLISGIPSLDQPAASVYDRAECADDRGRAVRLPRGV